MPSSKNYKRDYKQERRTAKKRGETGVGSESGDARRHRDRRKYENKNGKLPADKELHHNGRNGQGDTKAVSKKWNRSDGGKKGDKAGKSRGGRKGGAK